MKGALIAMLVLASAGATPRGRTRARPASAPTVESLRATERAWTRAFVTGDTAALERLLAPDYQSVTYAGQVRSRAEIIARSAAHRAHPLPVPPPHDGIVQIHGNTGIHRSDIVVTDPTTHQQVTVRFLDVFDFSDGRWTALYTQDVALSGTAR